jgi:hypothetical protein
MKRLAEIMPKKPEPPLVAMSLSQASLSITAKRRKHDFRRL